MQLNVNQIPSVVKVTDHDNLKHKLLESIYSNDNAMYYWSLISEGAEEINSIKVLKMIAKLWVTNCKFVFTSAWIELHKQAQNKGTQKSQASRKSI